MIINVYISFCLPTIVVLWNCIGSQTSINFYECIDSQTLINTLNLNMNEDNKESNLLQFFSLVTIYEE